MDAVNAHTLVVVDALKEVAQKMTLSNILSLLPKVGKAAVCVLFLLNIRSWPLVWHFRIFRPAILMRARHHLVMLSAMFKSPKQRDIVEDRWLDSISPIGSNPFTKVVSFKTWASFDDSDFNGHLSNSSYAKTCDSARFKAAVQMFPRLFPIGGWIPLAATHYHFINEIPMLSSYEVRTSIAAWDQKWLYVRSKFVRKSDGKRTKAVHKAPTPTSDSDPIRTELIPLHTVVAEDVSVATTPFSGTPLPNSNSSPSTESALKAVAADLAGAEPDGAQLHTIVVSQLCFKIGRITIPPALVLAINGFTGASGFSIASPHPQWAQVQALVSKPNGGSKHTMRKFLQGGWRDVPEGERWWETALGPEVEEKRARNLQLIDKLRQGLEGGRTI
ncbi:hypothetical protein BDN70DRAFT_876793 [Pholiota conissans]|uniref:Uncharacterized protein n=1 Tax=Pholiota conissans TaxID=109636 RepID=A0A9P6D2V6_9AGAR|nr:hypothetical protein BDN70DRAFT_876793 [Pholiota conissans]